MPTKNPEADLFQHALIQARLILHEVPSFPFREPGAAPAYTADLARFHSQHGPQLYGKRFFYRDQAGNWNAIDALTSADRLTGIALHGHNATSQWVTTLQSAKRRKAPAADLTRPAFLMTPGYNLHFLSFPQKASETPVAHLHLHDGFRSKVRAKLLSHPQLVDRQRQLDRSSAHRAENLPVPS